jgi:acyl carrier protein
MEVKSKVIELLENKLGIYPEEAKMEADIKNDLGADSLDKLEIVMECEKEFSIKIDDEQVDEIHTVGDLVKAVEDRKN